MYSIGNSGPGLWQRFL